MDVNQLVVKFQEWDRTNQNGLTHEETQFLLENEEHEAFAFDFGLFRSIMDYADYLHDED
jgi:hypothetical protein